MTFKELKKNYAICILRKSDIKFLQGKVIDVSPPHFQNLNSSALQFGQTGLQVVDITVEEGGKQRVYVVPEQLEVSSTEEVVIATSRDKIQYEVECIMMKAEEEIANVPKNEQIIANCKKTLTDINPELKERQKTEDRLNTIEANMNKMSKMIEQLCKKLE